MDESITNRKWAVYFDGSFWTHRGRKRAGKEIKIGKRFVWDNQEWYIPCAYACSQGLVIDFCIQVPVESIRSFIEKWGLSMDTEFSEFTNEQQMQIETENPLTVSCRPEAFVNGKQLSFSHSSALSWNPCFPEYNEQEAENVLKHYGLGTEYGWIVWRTAFPWATSRKPKMLSLDITLKHDAVPVSGFHFHLPADKERQIEFTHPITEQPHTLAVQEYELQEAPEDCFGDESYEYPTHYVVMSYTLSPDLSDCEFQIMDCDDGDRPRKKQANPYEPQSAAACAIIGAAAGITALTDNSGSPKIHTACSALHFQPVNRVEWRTVFYQKGCDDITIKLK